MTISFGGFVGLWAVALAPPILLLSVSPVAACLLGIAIPILWVRYMPCTCMGGALIAFPMAMAQVSSLLMWVGVAMRLLATRG